MSSSFCYSIDILKYKESLLQKSTPLVSLSVSINAKNVSQPTLLTFESNGNISDCIDATAYFMLSNDLNPQNYQSYNMNLTMTTLNGTNPTGDFYAICYLSIHSVKMTSPVLGTLRFSAGALSINISTLFYGQILQANQIYRIDVVLLNATSPKSCTPALYRFGNSPLPMFFSTITSDNVFARTPSLYIQNSNGKLLSPSPMTILAYSQRQTSISVPGYYPNKDNVPLGVKAFTDNLSTSKWEAFLVFQTNQIFNTNDPNIQFIVSVNNLCSTGNPNNIPKAHMCVLTCTIQQTVTVSPVLILPISSPVLDSTTGVYRYNLTVNVAQYFPNLLTVPSVRCYLHLQGYARNDLNSIVPVYVSAPSNPLAYQVLPFTYMSIFQGTIGSCLGYPQTYTRTSAAITSVIQPTSSLPNSFVYDIVSWSNTGTSSTAVFSSSGTNKAPFPFPINAKCNVEGYAQQPVLSIEAEALSSSILLLHVSQYMNTIGTTAFSPNDSTSYPVPTVIEVDIVFDITTPLNEIMNNQTILLTLRNLGYANPSNWNYVVSGLLQTDALEIYSCNNFIYQLGSGNDQGWMYTLYLPPYLSNPPYNTNSAVSYQNGPFFTDNMLLIPFPSLSFNAGEGYYPISLSTYNQSMVQWMGYLDIQTMNQWFGMYVKSADDNLFVEIFDSTDSTKLLCAWNYGLQNAATYRAYYSGPTNIPPYQPANFYRFTSVGLYPIRIIYTNTGGPGSLVGVAMGYIAGDPNFTILRKSDYRSIPQNYEQYVPSQMNNQQNPTQPGLNTLSTSSTVSYFTTSEYHGPKNNKQDNGYVMNNIFAFQRDIVKAPIPENVNDTDIAFNDILPMTPANELIDFLPPIIKAPTIHLDINNLFPQCAFDVGKTYKLSLKFTYTPVSNVVV